MKKISALLLGSALLGLSSVAFADGKDVPLVIATEALSEKFSPFYGQTSYDIKISDIVGLAPLTTDRVGAIVENAIEGEDRDYNGKTYHYEGPANVKQVYDEKADVTTYTVQLRKDIKFSDGKPLTADDLIFSYYVYLDPAYVGSTTLNTYDIIGLKDYRTQTSSDVYAKYAKMADDILAKGPEYKVVSGDSFTQEQVDGYWAEYFKLWKDVDNAIRETVWAKYKNAAPGAGLEEDKLTDADKSTLALVTWNLAKYDKETGILHLEAIKKDVNVKGGERASEDDMFAVTKALYEGDLAKFSKTESPDEEDKQPLAKEKFIAAFGSKDESMKGGVKSISGIKKVDDYTVEVKVKGFSAPAIYQIAGIVVAPKHYYGDEAQFKPEEGLYGHPFGDLSIVESKTTKPLGAGPYKFIKYENRVVYLEANEHFYLGAPKTKHVQFKETNISEVVSGIQSGTIDAGDAPGGKTVLAQIASYNSNKEVNGDVITVQTNDTLGYGYIGINSNSVNVGGGEDNAGTEASRNLRRAFCTVIANYRGIAVDSYYGPAASVINYPISNTSWAAPQPSDDGYRQAFSVDVDGNDIYTPDMDFQAREEAALKAAIGFLKKAGYTFDEASGKFTAAPKGAKMSYEIIIPAGGTGDHPAYSVITHAKEALAKIGIELKLNDPADSNVLWDKIDADQHELWAAAWGSTIDPDMYQIYHSSNRLKKGGTNSNRYGINDAHLDELIVDARKSADFAYRKAIYKEALDVIIDWAAEIPNYQRKDTAAFSTQRINIDTLAKDTTTYYPWTRELENVEMR